MNNSERFVFGIFEISLILRETLDYFIKGDAKNDPRWSVETYEARKSILKAMTAENSPFDTFVKDNSTSNQGEQAIGLLVKSNLEKFIKDCYSDEARIIYVRETPEGKKVEIETSLFMQLLDYVIGLKQTFIEIVDGYMNHIRTTNELEAEFENLVKEDERFYRALALKVCSMLFHAKNEEFNHTVNQIISNDSVLREHYADPAYKAQVDAALDEPNVNFIKQEINKVVGFMQFVIHHYQNIENDAAFKKAVDTLDGAMKFFSGHVKFNEVDFGEGDKAQTFEDFARKFANIFADIIVQSYNKCSALFNTVYNSIVEFEKEMDVK